uniref:Coiled-coil domain-containing protein 172 n=1 Tax=Xenopus tropicalis TaxID=8364 RepID=A0A6I8RKK4_XENTR
MSLDSLFQYILLTEQQASEMNRHLREVKSEIHRCQEEARSLTGRLEEAKATLETKVQRLAEKQCQRLLLKKHQDFLESQKEDLLKEKEELLTMRVCQNNRDLLLREQAKAEMEQIDMEAAALMSEIESLKHESFHVKALQVQKKTLSDNLAQLQNTLKDVEDKHHFTPVSKRTSYVAEQITVL